jgi:hypothetical protein
MHSDIVLRWYQGGRNVSSWTNHLGGKMTTTIRLTRVRWHNLRWRFQCRGIDMSIQYRYLDPFVRYILLIGDTGWS